MAEVDSIKVKDAAATVIGGGTGIDLFWMGLDGLWKSHLAHEPVEILHIKLLVYGIVAAVLGFLAWRDERHKVLEQTTVTKETVVKSLLIIVGLVSLMGCASTKGTMLDGRICTFATSQGAAVLKDQILATYTNNSQKTQANALIANMGATALCELLRDRESQEPKTVNLVVQ